MANYLIEGVPGTGKTTIGNELRRRGFRVVEGDKGIGYFGDPKTGAPTNKKYQLNWIWKREKLEKELSKGDEITFICGGAMNQNKFMHYFTKVFTLHVDNDILRYRIMNRIGNQFGKKPKDLKRQLKWNKGTIEYSKQRGTILIDATRPIEEIADDILSQVHVLE